MPMFPVIIMLSPAGSTPAEGWVAQGRRAAACDLVRRLGQVRSISEVFVLAADPVDREALVQLGAVPLASSTGTFHFGRSLTKIILENHFQRLGYFGGGSAPLMTEDMLQEVFNRVDQMERPSALVNNYHSTDWMVVNRGDVFPRLQDRLEQDNSLGWVLAQEADFEVQAPDFGAGSRVDIDTPTDLLMLHRHPSLGETLGGFIQTAPPDSLDVIDDLLEVVSTPASTVTLIGRTSPQIWKTFNDRTQIWVRAFAEERGMIASRRFERGEVRSLVGEMLEDWGAQRFVEFIANLSDGVLWDTRVWMAHRGRWPSSGDRFASDLGWTEAIQDEALKRLTQAVGQSDVPILLGGHGVVAGGIYALLESRKEANYQPSRKDRQS
jgi:hypothetical protein